MGKRDAQRVTAALMALGDVRQALENARAEEALGALTEAEHALESVSHAPGVAVTEAVRRLGVSDPTVRSWIDRGALHAIPDVSPIQIEPDSLRRVQSALDELRRRGQDRHWLEAFAEHLDDLTARQSPAAREGFEALRRGDVEPA